ncbi:MAG: FAD-dependent oxidoreductase [Nocardioides sp.]
MSGVGLWLDPAAGGPPVEPARSALHDDLDVDVAIVGAGFTGLWTAYYLLEAAPRLKIALLERQYAGFGASGRNGGWASALFPKSLDSLAAASSRSAALALDAEMRASVRELERVTIAEGIDAGLTRGGTLSLIRSRAQLTRARAELDHARSWGLGEDKLCWLDAAEASARLAGTRVLGATYTPDCAAVHPGKLVRGLAEVVERKGATIYERTTVTEIEPGRLGTSGGTVRATHIIRATEGFTAELPALNRAVVPVYSLMIASEPLDAATWDQIGLAGRETFNDHRNLIIYGQRTAEGRLVFGGRGAPYHYGSTIDPAFDRDQRVFARLHSTLLDLFPVLQGVGFTHAWGGPLGIARDWWASVGLDPATGIGWAGGYVGDGVTTTNLAGRTLRDLVLRDLSLGDRTELTDLPWVGHQSRPWEPEPLRWTLVNAGLQTMTAADAEESLTGRPSLLAKAMRPFVS